MAYKNPTVSYRDVPGFPGYRVGDDGTVWSCWKRLPSISPPGRGHIRGSTCVISDAWKRLTPGVSQRYCAVGLKTPQGGITQRRVHRLVLEAFVGPCPPGMEACHNDGNPANNALTNLRWDTRQANAADRSLHGTAPKGEARKNSKLTEDKVRSIRAKYATGTTSYRKLSDEYGVCAMAVSRAVRHLTWTHVP